MAFNLQLFSLEQARFESPQIKKPACCAYRLFQFVRRKRDSNPRSARTDNGFQDRRIRPLCHSSGRKISIFLICRDCFKEGCDRIGKKPSGGGRFRGFGRKMPMKLMSQIKGEGLEEQLSTKTQYLSTFQRFFLDGFLDGKQKKLYLYRIWLELKTFTNP